MKHKERIASSRHTYTVIFTRDEESGGFTATCPALPGLVTEGNTLHEARAMAADAIKGYLKTLHEDGLAIPPSDGARRSRVIRKDVTVVLDRA